MLAYFQHGNSDSSLARQPQGLNGSVGSVVDHPDEYCRASMQNSSKYVEVVDVV